MYAFIEGKVCEKNAGELILLAGGVGYQINCSMNTLAAAPALGETMRCYTYLSVREDAMELFGFASREEKRMFLSLTGVSGVGPKMALALLGSMPLKELNLAILLGDVTALSRAPGIGKKTAQRIALELKDKVSQEDVSAVSVGGADINAGNILVTEEEIAEAYEQVDTTLLAVIRKSLVNIKKYHEKQVQNSWFTTEDGIILGQKVTALATVGVYVPGGKAVYPSSVLMNVLPAKVAGVDRIVMCTPPGKDGKVYPSTLVAAKEAGVDEIYKVGGAQAIAAMAFGTESVPKVDKIVGPGNIYVALAKKAVFGYVSIDSIAGPSEILVLADETANPRYVAADLLSQAEHDEMASAILITTSQKLAEEVSAEIDQFVAELSRKEIIQKSLDNYGYILVADNMEEAIDTVNAIASEHMEIVTADPFHVMTKIRNAGAIFIGEYSSEPLGDYFAGPNHVLPTNGTAKFFSALSVDDFIKKSSIISYSREALEKVHKDIEQFAECEKLTAHANSIRVRFE